MPNLGRVEGVAYRGWKVSFEVPGEHWWDDQGTDQIWMYGIRCSICPCALRRVMWWSSRQRRALLTALLMSAVNALRWWMTAAGQTHYFSISRATDRAAATGAGTARDGARDTGEAGDADANEQRLLSRVTEVGIRAVGEWMEMVDVRDDSESKCRRHCDDAQNGRYQGRQTSPLKAGDWWIGGPLAPGGRRPRVDRELGVASEVFADNWIHVLSTISRTTCWRLDIPVSNTRYGFCELSQQTEPAISSSKLFVSCRCVGASRKVHSAYTGMALCNTLIGLWFLH